MTDWRVGDVAVCVDDRWSTKPEWYHPCLRRGTEYIVSGLRDDASELCLQLLGNPNNIAVDEDTGEMEIDDSDDIGFFHRRFVKRELRLDQNEDPYAVDAPVDADLTIPTND